jgi:hypothetical protein
VVQPRSARLRGWTTLTSPSLSGAPSLSGWQMAAKPKIAKQSVKLRAGLLVRGAHRFVDPHMQETPRPGRREGLSTTTPVGGAQWSHLKA